MAEHNARSDWIMVAAIVATFFIVTRLATPEKGLVAAGCVGVFAIVLATKFDFYRRSLRNPVFWFAVVALAVIHAIVIAKLDLPEFRSGMAAFPIIAIDGAVVWAVISLIERISRTRKE